MQPSGPNDQEREANLLRRTIDGTVTRDDVAGLDHLGVHYVEPYIIHTAPPGTATSGDEIIQGSMRLALMRDALGLAPERHPAPERPPGGPNRAQRRAAARRGRR